MPASRVAESAVGHDALDVDPVLGEERGRIEQEAGSGHAVVIGEELHEGQAGGIIDGHVEDLVADPSTPGRSSPTMNPMATPVGNAPQSLHVEVDELTGMLTDVPDANAGRAVQITETGEAVATQDRMNRRVRYAYQGRQAAGTGDGAAAGAPRCGAPLSHRSAGAVDADGRTGRSAREAPQPGSGAAICRRWGGRCPGKWPLG